MLCGTLAVTVAFLATFGALNDCAANETSPAIDQRAALEIGSYHLSNYLLTKYYDRFVGGIQQKEHRVPSSKESTAWLQLFLSQQIIIAHQEAESYGTRPDVLSVVAHMERHMLTQAAGPFYEAQLDGGLIQSDQDLEAWQAKMADSVEGIIAHFPDPANPADSVGGDFGQCSTEEKTERIVRNRDRNDVELKEGLFSWPFLPFSEITDDLLAAPIGKWNAEFKQG